jgi:hypothetical protein
LKVSNKKIIVIADAIQNILDQLPGDPQICDRLENKKKIIITVYAIATV